MKRIRVVTYNIHHGRGTDGCLSLQRIAEILRESRADLIGLNEVDNRFSARSDYTDQISWLSEHLQMHHVFGAAVSQPSRHPSRHRQYGNGLLSRYPVDGWKNHLFPAESPFAEGRALLEADVRVHDRVVRLFVTHLSLSPWKRRRQIAWMLEKIRNVPSPVILTGDGNMSPGSAGWKKIAGVLDDVCHSVGKACPTFPSVRPGVQLDYIFVSRHFRVEAAEVLSRHPMASDHRALLAELQWNI